MAIIYNQSWNIKNYRYIKDISYTHKHISPLMICNYHQKPTSRALYALSYLLLPLSHISCRSNGCKIHLFKRQIIWDGGSNISIQTQVMGRPGMTRHGPTQGGLVSVPIGPTHMPRSRKNMSMTICACPDMTGVQRDRCAYFRPFGVFSACSEYFFL